MKEFNEGKKTKSGGQADSIKNGFITPVQQKLEASRSESIVDQTTDVPHDKQLCSLVETTEKLSHAPKKHRISKNRKLENNDDSCIGGSVEVNGIHIQPNAVETENIAVVDSSETFSAAKKGVPKIIISRNADDSSKFIVKDSSTNSEFSLKRRRSVDDSRQKPYDGKRRKTATDQNDDIPVLLTPSIPIKLERRLSVRLEDVYGECKHFLLSIFQCFFCIIY